MQILHKMCKIHQCGFQHMDTDEHHFVGQNDDFCIIDLHNIEEHVCDFAGNFFEGKCVPNVGTFGCYELYILCEDMGIWDTSKFYPDFLPVCYFNCFYYLGIVSFGRDIFPVEQFPSQDVIDQCICMHACTQTTTHAGDM
jgi:hypothetical protein